MTTPNTATFLAVGGLTIIAAVLLLLFFQPVPQANASAMNIVLGAAIGWVGSAFAFYYGSTKTSQLKDDTISTMAAAAVTGTGTGAGADELPPGAARTTTTTITGPAPQPGDNPQPD